MYYIVQENVFKEINYDMILHSLERLGLDYEIVKVLPFTDEMEFKTDRKDVFVFGALKMARIAGMQDWKPGSLMNENHDYQVYKEYYRENLLNWDSKIYKFAEDFEWKDGLKFIRPCKDTKVFTGKVFDKIDWDDFVKYSLTNGHTTTLDKDTEIQVAKPKMIQKEIRLWVIDGRIVTGSQYRLGYRTVYDDLFEDEAIIFANEMIGKFQLADAFVMDVCLVDNEWKIVECGCINCAGFYKADLHKVLIALEDKFSS